MLGQEVSVTFNRLYGALTVPPVCSAKAGSGVYSNAFSDSAWLLPQFLAFSVDIPVWTLVKVSATIRTLRLLLTVSPSAVQVYILLHHCRLYAALSHALHVSTAPSSESSSRFFQAMFARIGHME